ncbi:MAG TPA: hypothetical protein DCY94_03130 [Firmicutes bacterium]|nr:hypothetical protein [Bacillota bacterium]
MEEIKAIKDKITEVYKEILPSSLYIWGCSNPRPINESDVEVFYEAMCKLNKMKRDYNEMTTNRAVLGEQITDLAELLRLLANRIKENVDRMAQDYEPKEELFIHNTEKIMGALFDAQNSPSLAIKKMYATGLGSFEVKHGTRETEAVGGTVYIIGNASILEEVDDEEVRYESDIRRLTKSLKESGSSLIVATNYCFDINLLPNNGFSSDIKIKGRNTIYCYLGADEMNRVLDKFFAFAAANGNHVDDIPAQDIINNISCVTPKTMEKNSDNI